MQGSIAFDGTLAGSITGSGGGSDVTITPTLTEGEKIADYVIDGNAGELYAPESGSEVTITPNYTAGFKVADYTIDGVAGVLYAPLTVNQAASPLEIIGNGIRIDLSDYYDKSDIDNNFQRVLTSGVGIKIGMGDIISAPDEYMAAEIQIGFFMGKPLYRKCYHFDGNNLPADRAPIDTLYNISKVIKISGSYAQEITAGDRRWYMLGQNPPQNTGRSIWCLVEGVVNDIYTQLPNMYYNGMNTSYIKELMIEIEYTKTTD